MKQASPRVGGTGRLFNREEMRREEETERMRMKEEESGIRRAISVASDRLEQSTLKHQTLSHSEDDPSSFSICWRDCSSFFFSFSFLFFLLIYTFQSVSVACRLTGGRLSCPDLAHVPALSFVDRPGI